MSGEESALLLFEEAMSFTYPAALRAAAALGVADHLADGPRTPAELADACDADADAVHRILRLLAGRDVFREDTDGLFHLTAKGDALRAGAPTSARSAILMFTDDLFWTTAQRLATNAREADPSLEKVLGMPLERYFDDGDRAALFYEGMAVVSDAENPAIVQSYDFPARGTVVDVGGRSGSLLLSVLRANPRLSGVMFDIDPAPTGPLDVADVADRWHTVQGDFFDEVPAGDVLVLKRILHNWDDRDCVRILEGCARALRPGGRVLAIDAIIPGDNRAHQSKGLDVMMLAALTGRERTAAQIERLFAAAGLRLERVIDTASVMSIAEGTATELKA
jgi:hypothetical protein